MSIFPFFWFVFYSVGLARKYLILLLILWQYHIIVCTIHVTNTKYQIKKIKGTELLLETSRVSTLVVKCKQSAFFSDENIGSHLLIIAYILRIYTHI